MTRNLRYQAEFPRIDRCFVSDLARMVSQPAIPAVVVALEADLSLVVAL